MERALMVVTAIAVGFGLGGEAIHLKDHSEIQYPPCFFNPLCTCSKAFPDLGRVVCKDVPMYKIPTHVSTSKVYAIHLENNGLRSLERHFLRHTGLYSIEISRNPLSEITEEAFLGLERTLWELDLHGNHLREVPINALRHLQKLKFLDLSGNEITFVTSEEWKGMEGSLEALSLSGNGIVALEPNSFAPLKDLQSLDLSGNDLFDVDRNAFRDGPLGLTRLNLADNVLSKIPYRQLSHLKFLRYLDLSLNRIAEMQETASVGEATRRMPLSLDTLRLDYNQIQFLPADSLKYFATINRTYFNGNPISKIQGNAFRGSKISELFLRDCDLTEMLPDALSGLEHTLTTVDLSGNNLTELRGDALRGFLNLRRLSLEENSLERFAAESLRDSLQDLDLRGPGNSPSDLRHLAKFRNIRSLSLSRTAGTTLSPEDFNGFSINFEDLTISDGNVRVIKSFAFRNVRRLKRLDLSGRSISVIEGGAFAEVGEFLQYLCLANGLSPSFSRLPGNVLKDLTALQHLDVSNNDLKHLDQSSFGSMKELKILQLQDNRIESIPKGTFQSDIHGRLKEINLSFNRIRTVSAETFADLDSLELLRMDDNQIRVLEKRSFVNLDKLKRLNLRGNKIDFVSHGAFENLPELEDLDLTYNKLTHFSHSYLDQVGILSQLNVNVSHNSITRLIEGNAFPFAETMRVNVKVMDFSYNNISHISSSYFSQFESPITHLLLSNNALSNLTEGLLSNMIHLQWLDISHNIIDKLDRDLFRGSRRIQVIKMTGNRLVDVPRDIFAGLDNLRVIELAGNLIQILPDFAFNFKSVERLDLSRNQLASLPGPSFGGDAAASVIELNLSDNVITSFNSFDAFDKFQSLHWLDLSGNPVARLEEGVFSRIPHLRHLDLSQNPDIIFNAKGGILHGLDDTLEYLNLANLSLDEVPTFHLPKLKILDLSHNKISTLPLELSQSFQSLRRLELSGNRLTSIPMVVNSLPRLEYLGLSGNELDSINFHRGSSLRELDIRNLPVTYMELGVLDHLQYLRSLRLSFTLKIPDFNLPRLLQTNHAIREIYLESPDIGPVFGAQMSGWFHPKLQSVTLAGKGFRVITSAALEGITSPRLNLVLFNTSVEDIPGSVFQKAKHVRNVTVDVRLNGLRSLGNPNSGRRPNAPGKSFLLSLKMADNKWSCDCELGWIEGWDRIRRRYLCGDSSSVCGGEGDDFRTSSCANRYGESLLEVFKTDLECGWNGSRSVDGRLTLMIALPMAVFWRTAASGGLFV